MKKILLVLIALVVLFSLTASIAPCTYRGMITGYTHPVTIQAIADGKLIGQGDSYQRYDGKYYYQVLAKCPIENTSNQDVLFKVDGVTVGHAPCVAGGYYWIVLRNPNG